MTNRVLLSISSVLNLVKIRISLSVSLTTFTGYIISVQSITLDFITPVVAVFLMASGASAFNHYQESEFDSIMDRTRDRPIPSGKISPRIALIISIICILSGSFLLLILSNILSFLLGLFALLWYNGVYTYLKRITPFAVIPGSLVGAVPPVIGWIAAEGRFLDPAVLALAFFFFIGQIPHFWLLLLKYGKEYELAGFRSLTEILDTGQLRRLTFTWISATAVSSLVFPLFGIVTTFNLVVILILLSLILIFSSLGLIMIKDRIIRIGQAFLKLNMYYLLIILILILDALRASG
jgi:protoheme IX farnesyltransferase